MKKIILAFFLCIVTIQLSQAQEIKKMDESPLDLAVFRPDGQESQPVARIIYSRPQRKGRVIFGELVPYGEIWRTGANQSTELNLYRDIIFEDKKLEAGNYTMYVIPGEEEWIIIINSKLFTWGTYDYDESKDVMMVTVPVVKVATEREDFGIAFDGENGNGKLLLSWENIEVYVDFKY
jgi:hypothetical protein